MKRNVARGSMLLLLASLATVRSLSAAHQSSNLPAVHAPYFDGRVLPWETAIFWFGRVSPSENYADVRVGYNDDELYLHLAAFDRRLWYDASPSPDDLTTWDAVTLFLDLDGNVGEAPDTNAYRLVGQLNWWEPRESWERAYRGDGSNWVPVELPSTATSGWRGNAPNDDTDDRGWTLTFRIPFASLGLTRPPPQGTVWGLAMILHDRDDAAGTSVPDKTWPEVMDPDRPATWAQLGFGRTSHIPPPTALGGTITIRHGLDGAVVTDAAVGGGAVCGEGLEIWTMWGEASYAGATTFNIQNQTDLADWSCFSKYYVTFPLDGLPQNKAVISASLTLHHWSNADWTTAYPSRIWAYAIDEDWQESSITWNNAPLARENLGMTWVDVLTPETFPGWPGCPTTGTCQRWWPGHTH